VGKFKKRKKLQSVHEERGMMTPRTKTCEREIARECIKVRERECPKVREKSDCLKLCENFRVGKGK
jgi:hypothetical protein